MPTIAPWVIPPNYTQIMESGAQTGLAVRRQAEEEAQAADRLRLAYDSLASQERRASEAAQARREASMAAMELRASQNDALNAYRAGQLKARDDLNQQHAANMMRLAGQFKEREQRLMDEFGVRQEGVESRFTRGQEATESRFERGQEGTQGRFEDREKRIREMYGEGQKAREAAADLSAERAVGRMKLGADLRELGTVKKDMAKIEEGGGPGRTGLFYLSTKQIDQYNQLKKRKDELEKEIEGARPAAAGLREPAASAAKPVKEVIRVTKDGRRAVFDADSKKFLRYAD